MRAGRVQQGFRGSESRSKTPISGVVFDRWRHHSVILRPVRLFAPSVTTSLFYVALVRIALGLTFLSHFAGQMLGLNGEKSWLFGDSFRAIVDNAVANSKLLPFYANFLTKVVQPNESVFSYLILLGELAVGISLTLGVFTRLGAIGGILLTANIILLKGLPSPDADIDHVFLICELAVLFANAGRVWGIDGLLFAPAPPSPPSRAITPSRSNAARAS